MHGFLSHAPFPAWHAPLSPACHCVTIAIDCYVLLKFTTDSLSVAFRSLQVLYRFCHVSPDDGNRLLSSSVLNMHAACSLQLATHNVAEVGNNTLLVQPSNCDLLALYTGERHGDPCIYLYLIYITLSLHFQHTACTRHQETT